jgi:pullulanase
MTRVCIHCVVSFLLSSLLWAACVAAPSARMQGCESPQFQTVLSSSTTTPNEASAVWLSARLIQWPNVEEKDKFRLYYAASGRMQVTQGARVSAAEGYLELSLQSSAPEALQKRFKYLAKGAVLQIENADKKKLRALHQMQLLVVNEDAQGHMKKASYLQAAAALDELYAKAGEVTDLGATVRANKSQLKLWAPTARAVSVCAYGSGAGPAIAEHAMRFNATTGAWSTELKPNLSGKYYTYLVEVFVKGVGWVRNRVTDPYSISLTTDSKRSYIQALSDARLKPKYWDNILIPATVSTPTDMTIYELHVRDFSINDASVAPVHRGKYTAFAQTSSNGMKHLQALAKAGLTDIHLLPVFDIASVPEAGCATPTPTGAPDSEEQQASINATKDSDCYNWGYDPYHYTAPEGSYSSNAADGAVRILEFRQMVLALHKMGLRVGMDVVYNHTTATGQNEKSVLDRIVPGYYHRLNAQGAVETSTCCQNTATENLMMGKLMTDSVLTWAKQYKIDSFRFDLMGHQPRALMQALKARLKLEAGRDIELIGEGWNFGEVADGARFVQASQHSLAGSGIGTFSDRARDALRGGGYSDTGDDLIKNQGYLNGLIYDPNAKASASRPSSDSMKAADLVRVGLAGSISDYQLLTYQDASLPLSAIDYNGQGAGYVSQPSEVVNYVENHDNETLFDINAYKLPVGTKSEDRARVQILGAAITAFSQGIAYFHAGIDTLRSKSMDRNSFDSGDWFNRLDWTYGDNYFGAGLPPKQSNEQNWAAIKPLLAQSKNIKPSAADIAWSRDAFRDLLKIRASSSLLHLRTAEDIKSRLRFYNTGSKQVPTILVGHLFGEGYSGANFREMLYFINVDNKVQQVEIPELKGRAFTLHPVHTSDGAADTRPKNQAGYDKVSGTFTVPARTALVFVVQ